MSEATQPRVELVAYDAGWPGEFRTIGNHLRSVLGETALRIDHIGSTAVPGLASKNVIDVQVTVQSLENHGRELLSRMVAAGYQYRLTTAIDHRPPGALGPDSDWQKLFLYNAPEERRCNIHVRVAARPNQIYPLLVRDFLRAHPHSAEAYSRLKFQLAGLVAANVYPDVKDPVCDLIFEHALDWSSRTGWRVGPSDA